MPTPSTMRRLRCTAASLLLAIAVPVAGQAQSKDGTASHTTSHRRSPKGNANQPAPTEHQAVPPSARLKDEPNQVKEQVAPVPAAPVKPGTNVQPGQDTPSPHRN